MNYYFKISFVLFLLTLTSCEEIGIIEEEVPFRNLYVIDGQITPNTQNPIINFTKSVPIDDEFDISKFTLADVNAYIWSDHQGIYSLTDIGNGQYRANNLEIEPNRTYELFGEIEGNRVYAKTKIPNHPEIVGVSIENEHLVCEVKAKKDEVYSCIYVLSSGAATGAPRIYLRENDFFAVEGPAEENQVIKIRSGRVPKEYLSLSSGTLGIEVYAWDKSYKEYFETKDNNKQIDDIFSQGGGPIKWNVRGENTIGLFLGYAIMTNFNF